MLLLLLQTPTPTPIPADPNLHFLALVMGWTVTILVAAFALMIIFKMVRGDINLQYLIAGSEGDASLSRFQFLIFTFVIGLGLFLIIVSLNPPAFPTIPGGILALLGISGGSYVTSKAVDANARKPTAGDTTVVYPPTQPSSGTTVVVPPPGP